MANHKHPSPEAYLIPFPAESFSKPVPITIGITSIGRGAANTIQIADHTVSENHAQIALTQGGYLLTEIDSQKRTYVNGKKVKTAPLQHHDKISFGNRNFLFLMKSKPLRMNLPDPSVEKPNAITFLENEVEPSDTTALGEQQNLIVSVADNGAGIAPERQAKIFELFYTTKGTGGSGLGLPMAKKFVEKMGGTLTVQSEVNAGATFTLTFPKNTPLARQTSK